jgi:hypothetical protein
MTGLPLSQVKEDSDHSQKEQDDDDQKNQANPAAPIVANARAQSIAAKSKDQKQNY